MSENGGDTSSFKWHQRSKTTEKAGFSKKVKATTVPVSPLFLSRLFFPGKWSGSCCQRRRKMPGGGVGGLVLRWTAVQLGDQF